MESRDRCNQLESSYHPNGLTHCRTSLASCVFAYFTKFTSQGQQLIAKDLPLTDKHALIAETLGPKLKGKPIIVAIWPQLLTDCEENRDFTWHGLTNFTENIRVRGKAMKQLHSTSDKLVTVLITKFIKMIEV